MKDLDHRRRQFLQYALAGTVAAALPNFARAEDRYILNTEPDLSFKPDVEIEFIARVAEVPILRGAHTSVFKYDGKVLRGPQSALKTMSSYLGPIMRLAHGQKVRIFYYNKLPEPSIMHWHGMHVPQKMDGHPMSVIEPGERYVYEFEVKNPAGTNWYHAHPHDMTGPQVYRGQAGLITVTDEEEQKLGLPDGEYDIPLIIQDRRFTAGNQLQYIFGMHERMSGFLGDTILVNGQADTVIPVKTRAYRVRVLNGSNSRIYKLGWEDGTPLTAIGTDGGLLEAPQTRPYIMLAPAERVELWVDFSGRKPGTDLWLRSLEYELPQMGAMGMGGGMGGMRGGRMGGMEMMAMPHPIHLHGQQFRVVSRTMTHKDTGSYATVREGFINSGWKDTVLVMPGEEIDIIKPFEDYTGLFLYHCHNLEHEDLGMMRNFYVN